MSVTRKDVAKMAALAGGQAALATIPTDGVVIKEGRGNFVTKGDLASEKAIISLIRKHFPSDEILSEETESQLKDLLTVEHLWVIDPIDGTNNYRNGRNYSAVSVAYVESGQIVDAAAYDPFRKELFTAHRGGGAFLNGRAIKIGEQKDIHKAVVATDNSYDPDGTRHNLQIVLAIDPTPWVLVKGSAVLTICEVACGRTDLYFHTALKPWDNAAAMLIAEEAGAIVTDLKGNKIAFTSPEIVVGNPELVKEFARSVAPLLTKNSGE